nr:hypothetical protein [Tanacetum cinerariifolium]GFA06940.1 hypothetical protein [Tanacetum cinerariifolium]GFA07383.1 hypothetical protein [Tanacetum cinerariifolium]
NILDVELVPIDEQVKFGHSNFRIDLEKSQPEGRLLLMIDQDFLCFNFFREWSQNNHISKRLQSYQHVIKIDATLGNLKFTNKGAKDLVFGMSIPTVMLNDDIKASADYSKYLVKSKGGKSKGRGKGLVTKQGVKVAGEKMATVQVLKKKRTK